MKTFDPKTGYNLYSLKYRSQHAYLDSFDRKEFIGDLPVSDMTLDIGAGDGRLFSELEKKSSNVISLDISKELLLIGRSKNNISVVSDALCIPFRAKSFDLAVASFLLVHIKMPGELFTEIHGILKNEGTFIFNIIPQKTPLPLFVFNKKFIIESYYHSPSKIENQLKMNGFYFKKKQILNDRGKWTSIVYVCRKT
ncbi:class I SAM-dependent methyltransferase [candidate division WOR-3 bacterium]|nr:class I SAM-dependent methyltransferase [candidate division WOR-3 bacterium]